MDFNEMCRTCLRSGEVMSSIFDEEVEPAKHTAADLLAMFTSVQVDKEDCFPHNICDICLKEIRRVYLFDLKCTKSEIILHQLREITVNLTKLIQIPKQIDIISEGSGELESIIKEDFKQEDIMNFCDRNIRNPESRASQRIGSVEEENANASEELNLQMLEGDFTRDFQLAFKRESGQGNHFMKDVKNDHDSPIIQYNAGQSELELNQNSSNFEILDECASKYQVIFKTDPDQNNLVIKDIENEEELEFSEILSNFQTVEEEGIADFRVSFKTEPELDIGIDCNDEQLKCSACLKQFQSLDMFRDHIVSDHLEENNCKLCDEEFECSQFEHSAKHLPLDYDEHMEIEENEKFRHGETSNAHIKAILKAEFFGKPSFQCMVCSKVFVFRYRLVSHMRTHTGEKPFECELCPEKFGYSKALLCHRRIKHTDKFISNDKPIPDFQCNICNKVFGLKCRLRVHMRTHTGEKPFSCELCPEKLGSSNKLLYHRRTKHTDELISNNKPVSDIQCSVCQKVFGHKFRLRDHMRIHTGEKPFDCELCPEKFGNSRALQYHRRTKHKHKYISDGKPVSDFQCKTY